VTADIKQQLVEDYTTGVGGQVVLGRKYGLATSTIYRILKKAGVQKKTSVVNAVTFDVDEAVRLYESGKTSPEVATLLGVSQRAVWLQLKKRGVKMLLGAARYRSLDRSYFSDVNPTSAYFAGFIAADGNISGHTLQFGLAPKDTEWLENFRKVVGIPQQVKVYKDGYPRLSVVCEQWCADLERHYNIVPRKSLILEPPSITDERSIWAYVRGYFDGDGSANKAGNQINICSGSKVFLEWIIRDVMRAHHSIFPCNGSWLSAVSGPVMRNAIDCMYRDSTPETRLSRKYERLVKK